MYDACDREDPYDCILMDYEMPKINGPTATTQLRLKGCKIPIIGVTGNVMGSDIDLFVRHGANEVLGKPLKLPQLMEAWSRTDVEEWSPVPGSELDRLLAQ